MPKKSTFGKRHVEELIAILKSEGIQEANFIDLRTRVHKDFPNHGKNDKDLYVVLRTYAKLFTKQDILIYNKEDRILENGIENIDKASKYIKYDLEQDTISLKNLASILIEKYDFRLHMDKQFITRYKVNEILEKYQLNLIEGHSQRYNTVTILEEFAASSIVKEYKQKKKKFSLESIAKLLKYQVSIATLYNYSVDLVRLGIPIEENKRTINYDSLTIKDIINSISSDLLSENIREIFAGKFAKKAYKYSLPTLKADEVLEYSEYIQKTFGIKILDRKKDRVNKSIEPIIETLNFLDKYTTQEPTYEDSLPLYNDSDSFIIKKNLDKSLEALWKKFIQEYISVLSDNRVSMKSELLDDEGKIRIDTENKKIIFLQHDNLHINDLDIFDIIKLTHMSTLSGNKSYQVHKQNMYISFLFFLHSENLLLFPLKDIFQTYYADKKTQSELEMYLLENTFYTLFKKAEEENRLQDKDIKKQRIFYFLLYSFSLKLDIQNIDEEMIESLNKFMPKEYTRIRNIFRTLGSSSFPPLDNSLQYTKEYYDYMKDERYTSLIEMFNKHMNRMVKLEETKTPKGFNKKFSGVCVSFFRFLDAHYPSMDINAKSLYQIFDYPDSKILTYQEHVEMLKNREGQPLGDGTKNSKLYPLSIAFSKSKEYKNVFNPSKIPNYSTGSGEESSRIPIDDDEIILKLDDIVTNRPPKSDYFKNHKVHIDTSWWKHMESVRPFEPLIIKLHLRIPARGKTLRLTDRDTLLVTNSQNEITGFNFKSDKFKKRTTPFIVPNIWQSELNFLVNLIEYNKHYFPKLSRVPVDDTTIPQGIMPLFPNDDGTSEFKDTAHLAYWRKVLMQAEIEFRQEGKHYDLVKSETVELPQTVEDMEMLTKGELDTFKRKYDLHSLRHTGITRYITGGMPLELVRMLSGHSGYNTLLTVYYHVNQQALIDAWTKKENIDPTAILNMHDVSDIFIKKKLIEDIESENPDEVLQVLKDEYFFNLSNRSREKHENIQLSDIAKLDPTYYSSADGCGICPKRVCPDEFAGRCSLCPYFTTNYLFVEEIGLRVQLSMDRTKKFSELMNKNREKKENQKNKELKKDLLLEMENFYGWMEVLALIDDSYKNMEINATDNKSSQTTDNKSLTAMSSGAVKSMFAIVPALDVNHANLDTLSKAYAKNMLDNETVQDITNYMANKLIRYTYNKGNYREIESLSNEEIIKWFLPKYDKLPKDWHNNRKSEEEIKNFLEIFEKKDTRPLKGSNHENTLLAQ